MADIPSLAFNGFALHYGSEELKFGYSLDLIQTVGGSITADKLTGIPGDIVTLSNTPSSNYEFTSYSLTGANLTGSQFAFGESDVSAQANFLPYVIASGTFDNSYTAGSIYYYIEGSRSGGVTNTRGISQPITLGGQGRLMVYRHGTKTNPDYYGISVINEAATARDTGWAAGKISGLNYVSSIGYSYDVYSALVSANPGYYTKTVVSWDPIRLCDSVDHYNWNGYWELYRI